MRGGVTLAHATGTVRAENCIAIGNEQGFGLGSGTAVNCKSDVAYGHAFKSTYDNDSWDLDIEIIPAEDPYYNGQKCIAFIGMDNSDLTLKGGDPNLPSDYRIQVGGKLNGVRFHDDSLDYQSTHDGNNNSVTNETPHTIRIASGSEGNTIETCGRLEDYSTNNTLTAGSSCSLEIPCQNTFDTLQAECYNTMSGVGVQNIFGKINEKEVYSVDDSDWISFEGIDLTGVVSVKATASSIKSGGSIEVRSGGITGTLLGTISIDNTTSYNIYQEFSTDLTETFDGETDIYFVFSGGSGWLFNLDKINFIQSDCYTNTYQAEVTINAKDYCESSGITIVTNSTSTEVVSNINDSDYLRFSNVDFGHYDVYNSIEFFASSSTSGGSIEVRSGSISGNLLATVTIENTGNWDQYESFSNFTSNKITGIHDLYFIFKGASGDLFNLDWFKFSEEALDNLALASNGAVASQSTTDYEGVASRANDGNTSGAWANNSVSHTEHGTNGSNTLKWWQVNLGSDKTINEIVIFNRTGSTSYSQDLNNFTVEIINNNGYTTFTQTFVDYPNPSLIIDIGSIVGKIVRVSKTSNRGIQLAEVEVYGTNTTLSVNDFVLNEIKLYPNPATNEVTISNVVGSTIEIYNISGALEAKFPVLTDTKRTISIENLKSGVHFIKFKNEQGITIKKIIKL